jgi:hypothetical protein
MDRGTEKTPHEERLEDNMKINIDGVSVLRVRADGGHF